MKDLVRRLRHWVETVPDRIALTFLEGDNARETSYTFAELDARARAVAVALRDRRPSCAGARALIVAAPGIDFVVAYLGCVYAGAVAVPTYAPHPAQLRRSLGRFIDVVRDARPDFFVTTSAYALGIRALKAAVPSHWRSHVIDVTALDSGELAPRWSEPDVGPETIALLQYTSGSTSSPRGVLVSHANLVDNLGAIQALAADIPEPIGVSWLPPYHDMGLIGGILQPLFAGFHGVIMSPLDFLQRPVSWLEAITRHRATVSPLPNFALELCARKVTDAELDTLDLRSWRVAINGAEPVRKESLDRFNARFGPRGFRPEVHRPVYGLAEATLMVSCETARVPPRTLSVDRVALERGRVAPARGDARALVSCGRPIAGATVAIVDPETRRRCPPGTVGEIWIRGPSVAQGYWRKPEETAATFGARLADGDDGPYLRTGDLGFVDGGELFVAGRRKDLIIVRGKNYYPQDIEAAAARSHPAVRPGGCVAFGLEDDEAGERVVVVAETDPARGGGDVGALIRTEVRAGVGIDVEEVVLIRRGSMPKTSSGKVQRYKCKDDYLAGKLARA